MASAAPIDILVDGATKITGAIPSIRAMTITTAKTAYVPFEAQADQDVVILFRAQTSSNAATKNVMINGVDLNVPNLVDQASNPSPANTDEHFDCDSGSLTLSNPTGDQVASDQFLSRRWMAESCSRSCNTLDHWDPWDR